jgi:hypothetical protein
MILFGPDVVVSVKVEVLGDFVLGDKSAIWLFAKVRTLL